jgi:cyanobactin maturation PatA/PatG family protease
LDPEHRPYSHLRNSAGGGFVAEVYQRLVDTLAGQNLPPDDLNLDCISRMSLAGVLTGKTVQLYSGQVVPVVVPQLRGMYSWSDNFLISTVLTQLEVDPASQEGKDILFGLQMFIDKIYYELRNVGQSSAERALNYSAANLFQAGTIFKEQAQQGWQLDTITVTRSPFCRIDSDCWDVSLKFMNPTNLLYARKVYSSAIDVSAEFPVAVGTLRTYWSAT